jgi:hypothetical protein
MTQVIERHTGKQSFGDETLLWRYESQKSRKISVLQLELPGLADEIVSKTVV